MSQCPKDAFIKFRVPAELAERAKSHAKSEGLSLSQFLRNGLGNHFDPRRNPSAEWSARSHSIWKVRERCTGQCPKPSLAIRQPYQRSEGAQGVD